MEHSRRALLRVAVAGVAGGVAGCSDRPTDTTPTASPTDAGTDTASPTPKDPSYGYSGATIPESPQVGNQAPPPLAAGPHPDVQNPVLTPADVTDYGDVQSVTDPFLFVEEGTFHLFFEVLSADRDPKAVIGHATSPDGLEWTYDQVVIEPDAFTSWPYVWKWDGEYYMAPYSGQRTEIWRATSFPTDWERVAVPLAADYPPHDPAFVRWDDRWWLFVGRPGESGAVDTQTLAFHSDTLVADDWTPHEGNPIVSGREQGARPGGRPVRCGDDRYLFFQGALDQYGDKVRAYRITELSPTSYADEEVASSPVASEFGIGYNAEGMHTYDPWYLGQGEGWLCAVDGKRPGRWTGIGLFHVPESIEPASASLGLDREPGLYYRFGIEGGVAVDDSGSGQHGMVRGTEPTEDGLAGGRRFPEPTDRVVAPYDLRSTLDGQWTLLAYAAPGGDGTETLWDYRKRGTPSWLTVERTGGRWRVAYTGETGEETLSASATDGSGPVQVAVVGGRDATRLYLDGDEVARGAAPAVAQINNYLTIGADLRGESPWSGTVAQVGAFGSALTSAELDRVDERLRDG